MTRTAHAAVVEKQIRAIALHGEGCSYDEIAEQLGYANRGSAWKAVDRGLRAERDGVAGEYLQMQVDRYEKVLFEWWNKATTGQDPKAANVVLRTLERLDNLLRLTKGDHTRSDESVVIAGDARAYVEELQQVVEQRARSAPR